MYADFEVRIHEGKAPGRYRVEVVTSSAGPADGEMVLHLVGHGSVSGQIALVGDDHTSTRRWPP